MLGETVGVLFGIDISLFSGLKGEKELGEDWWKETLLFRSKVSVMYLF